MEAILSRVFQSGHQKHFTAGEMITTGQDVSGVFLVTAGFVKVYSISDDGSLYVHIIYKPGEIFPLIWALLGHRRRVFYEALTDTDTLLLPRDVFEEKISRDQAFCQQVLKGLAEQFYIYADTDILLLPRDVFEEKISRDQEFCQQVLKGLAEQFYIYADRIDNLQYKSAYERVVYRLLFLAGRFGRQTAGGIVIEAPFTHELIAQTVNLARESVSRQIEKLEKKGLVTHINNRIAVKNPKALSREFSEPISLNLWGLKQPKP